MDTSFEDDLDARIKKAEERDIARRKKYKNTPNIIFKQGNGSPRHAKGCKNRRDTISTVNKDI